jgi:hypothetical protein
MKNIIYLNNIKEDFANKHLIIKQLSKLDNLNNKKDIIQNKFIELFNKIIKCYNTNDYNIILNFNYLKILESFIVAICLNYYKNNKKKPSIIISYYESNYINNLCKKLLKNNIIREVIVINSFDVIEDFKKNKTQDVVVAFISNINNNIYYNLAKLSTFCKHYNICLISNIENIIHNYIYKSNENTYTSYLNNQDIILLNYYTNNSKYYFMFIKKTFINKHKLNSEELKNNISKDSLIYLINAINYYNNFDKNYKSICSIYENVCTLIKSKYRIISYDNFIKTDDIYFTNVATIVIFTNIYNNLFTLNNITFSIYLHNIKCSNGQLFEHLKSNNVITNTNYKLPNDISKSLSNNIVSINLSNLTKLSELNKLIKLIDEFINLKLLKSSKPNSSKKKKRIHFNNPEFIILNKPYRSKNKNSKMPLKSILKKK